MITPGTKWPLFYLSGILSAMSLPGAARAADLPPSASNTDYERELGCLAQAISYEAGNESEAGQEAVAQVVLNRVRHPAYPPTVCGVVYQGSERKTGCQFTFTCDGSLTRNRSAVSMGRARVVAERVLSGQASTFVGGATHYHANYVSPYWAPRLVKIAQIGAHIFYRIPGAPDSSAYFASGSSKNEPAIVKASLPTSMALARVARRGQTFSVWGLPALVIDRNGDIRPAGK